MGASDAGTVNTLAIFLLMLVAIPHSGTAQQPRAARVLSATSGAWAVKGKELVRGSVLKPDDAATAKGGGDLLVDCDSAGVYAYSCPGNCNVGPVCDGPYQKPARASGSPLSAVLAAPPFDLSALFKREAKEPAVAAARAGGNPSDAVLLLDSKGVHWGPALIRVLEGRYCLRVSLIPSGTAQTVSVEWDRARDSEGIQQAPGLTPGLYGLEKGTPGGNGCQVEADGTTAWVVVASPTDFERLSDGWKKYTSPIAELESSGAANSIVVTVRHAVLAGLADSMATR